MHRSRPIPLCLTALILAVALAFACALPQTAYAAMTDDSSSAGVNMESAQGDDASSSDDVAAQDADAGAQDAVAIDSRILRLSGASSTSDGGDAVESIGCVFPSVLDVRATPEVISTGVECTMNEFCGIDPCTCGKPDAWGHCACAGFQDTRPDVQITLSDPSVATVEEAFGLLWIVPHGAGSTAVEITASLPHFQSATYSFELTVEPFGAMDVLLIAAALGLVLLVALALFCLVRLGIRFAVRLHERHIRRKTHVDALRAEHPITWRSRLRSGHGAGRPHRISPACHDFCRAMRTAAPVLVCALVLLCALMPISTSVVDEVSVFNVDYTHEQVKFQFYAPSLSAVVNFAYAAFGLALGIALFRFLLAKRSTTAFFSVGISRSALFGVRFIAGFACILIAAAVPFALSLAVNVAALGLYQGEIESCAYVACGYALVALAAFCLAGIATVRSGMLFEAVVFSLALLCGMSAVLWSVGVLAQYLLVGNAAGMTLYDQAVEVAPSLLKAGSAFNPLLFFMQEGADYQTFSVLHPVYYPSHGSWGYAAAWLGACLVLAAFAFVLFVRRSGEQAEMAGRSTVLSVASVAVIGLGCFAAAVYALGPIDVAVAIAVAFALFVLVSLAFLMGPLRGKASRLHTLACLCCELVAMGGVIAVMGTGAFGYSSYVPSTDEVVSVEVSYNGSPSYLTEGFAGVSSGASYYYTSDRSYDDVSSIDTVRAVHEALVSTARAARVTDYDDFSQTVVPYDVVIRYELADGSECVRYFSQASVGELETMLSLDDSERSHQLETAVITGDTDGLSDSDREAMLDSPAYNAYKTGSIYVADGALNRIAEVDVSDEDRAALQQALAADLAGISADERYSPSSQANAILMFTMSPGIDVSSFGYSFSNAVTYVTDAYPNTLSWLESHGYVDASASPIDPSIVEELTIQRDDPYSSINEVTSPQSRYFMAYRTSVAGKFWITQDFGAPTVITDEGRIADIAGRLRAGCYMTGGYLVQAKLHGIESYVYFYLPEELAPDYL